jgi:hypothetical protein
MWFYLASLLSIGTRLLYRLTGKPEIQGDRQLFNQTQNPEGGHEHGKKKFIHESGSQFGGINFCAEFGGYLPGSTEKH